MELEPIGRVDDPDDLDLEPIIIPIVGYIRLPGGGREEVIERIEFRPVQPTGAGLAVLRQTRADGNVPVAPVMKFLDACVLEGEELTEARRNQREAFEALPSQTKRAALAYADESGGRNTVVEAAKGLKEPQIAAVNAYLRAADETARLKAVEPWRSFLDREDVFIEQETLIAVYSAITEVYSDRPTRRRSVSHNGRTTSTSRGAASGKASTSGRSR